METLKFSLIFIVFPLTHGAVPGTFFWKPRLGIDLHIPKRDKGMTVSQPTKENVREGLVVLIDGYEAGITVVALAAGLADAAPYPHLNPTRSYFYTNAYRWALRHISMLPFWLGGGRGNYVDTHKVWKRRFYYTDEFMPKWLRSVFFYVDEKDWKNELKDHRRYKKFSEFSFAKHYRYPSKKFNDFRSLETKESTEKKDSPSSSFLSSKSYNG